MNPANPAFFIVIAFLTLIFSYRTLTKLYKTVRYLHCTKHSEMTASDLFAPQD